MGISIGGFNGPRLAEVKSVSAHGAPGCGAYVLYLRLTALVGNLKSEVLVSQLACRLEIAEPFLKIANGVIEGSPVTRWAEYTDDSQLGFFFYLSPNQVDSIELIRVGGDLKLSIWLSGVVNCQGEQSDFSDKGDFIITKQQWIETLDTMGYQDTLLFELPMPNEVSLKVLLERAHKHILNGDYQESIGICRQAIEMVEKNRKDKKKASEAVAKYKENRQEMNAIERMLFLREGVKNITQLGAHHGDGFSRQQAQSVLGMTVALLSSPEIGLKK
ncbi:MAG: hypothetical protein KZQ96_16220 [Candidatus Thiodiazotropha sp. (ex Lucinoma borealis)]|nr:hypothetical protein [Candidatus Thiodiazotropha sp. (ex Lucinoma borealis)]